MSNASATGEPKLSSPHSLEYTYKRSLGPTLGRFFTGLRDHKIEGVRTKAGEVLIPPAEYDPKNGEATTDDWVEVGPAGTVFSGGLVSISTSGISTSLELVAGGSDPPPRPRNLSSIVLPEATPLSANVPYIGRLP